LGLKADIDLDLMCEGQTLGDITIRVLRGMQDIIRELRPDLLLVQGDTTTAMASSLAAFYEKVPVGHIEAGLRSFDTDNPYPEEVNRRMISVLASMHFAPTERAGKNLTDEGIPADAVFVVGNTIVDSVRMFGRDAKYDLEGLDFVKNRVMLVTAHRRENWDSGIRNICVALSELINDYEDLHVVYPVHLNPAIKKQVWYTVGNKERFHLVEPLGYLEFLGAMKECYLIVTDSGGVQEEAPSFGKPLLVTRVVTERPEAYEQGYAKVIGTDISNIVREVSLLLDNRSEYDKMVATHNPYGDGKASMRIVGKVLDFLTGRGKGVL
jgi:UDP-N-acetylglucosamine 2-epimerase (non-hydrolysing)